MPVFLYPPMLEVRALVARFARPMAAHEPFVAPVGTPSDDRIEIARTMRELLSRFGRRRQHPTRHGGDRVRRCPPPSIAPAVDAGNHAALASGFPVAVVDLDRLQGELRVSTTAHGTRMLDERGVSRDVGKLPCIVDARGPCVTPVALRHDVRVTAATTATLSIVFAHDRFAPQLEATVREHRAQLERLGGRCEPIVLPGPADDPVGRALLQLVIDDPSDDHARLVFADWLDTFDNACYRRRARLIRESIAGADPWMLRAEVIDDVGAPPAAGWSRGFIQRIALGERIPRVAPVLHREPVEDARVDEVVHDALPASVWEISTHRAALGAIAHRAPQRIRKLQASGHPTDELWRWLGTLSALEWLSLRIGDDDLVQLPPLEALRSLHIEHGRCERRMLEQFAPTLEVLYLNMVDLDETPRLPRLRKLTLYRSGVTSLAFVDGLSLVELHVDATHMTMAERDRILGMETLEVLYVSGNEPLQRAIESALAEGALPNLRAIYGLYVLARPKLRPR